MRFTKINKVAEGNHLNMYSVEYIAKDNRKKSYEMVSRNDLEHLTDIGEDSIESVVIIATNAEEDKILLNHEYRMAIGTWVYNFPSGMVDEGETPVETARRELQEETGLYLYEVTGELINSYAAVGISNEKSVCILGKAHGLFAESTSSYEEINAQWYSKAEVREMIKTERFSSRAQMFCYLWSKE